MKTALLIFLFAFCYVECRKIYPPVNKQVNVDFINMEAGPGGPPVKPPQQGGAVKPVQPTPSPVIVQQKPATTLKPIQKDPLPTPVTVKPMMPTAGTNTPTVKPKTPTSGINTSPVNQPKTPTSGINTSPVNQPKAPASGKVADLVNFYDSQGKGSPIRPYSYSQAVKQG